MRGQPYTGSEFSVKKVMYGKYKPPLALWHRQHSLTLTTAFFLTILPIMLNYTVTFKGALAQSVEQRTENPCVPSSILGGATMTSPVMRKYHGVFFLGNGLI
jgi:hypothetical protein